MFQECPLYRNRTAMHGTNGDHRNTDNSLLRLPTSDTVTQNTERLRQWRHPPSSNSLNHRINIFLIEAKEMSSIPCTCQEPPVVKLLENDDNDDETNQNVEQQLLQNLRHFGWSPIQVRVPFCPPPTQAEIAQLFHKNDGSTKHPSYNKEWIYRSAESGGSETLIEPKESLEVSHKTTTASTHRVHDWYHTMSFIAHKVCSDVLKVPPNTLLASSAPQNDNDITSTNTEAGECIDLMRVFYYHKITAQTTSSQQLGSSPHTDWGSWTVVWQDGVGGLETYCRACSKWVPVPAAPAMKDTDDNNPIWQCIVHVGDMTSLTVGLSPDDDDDNFESTIPSWPSPKHRVVCSTESIRTSLVYFAYPPSHISMKEIQGELVDWRRADRGMRLPLEEYYLLRDQSSGLLSASSESSPESTYAKIAPLSIQQAIETKWNQVQRTAT
jgi:hypothetical protein